MALNLLAMSKEIAVLQHIGIERPGTLADFFSSTVWQLRVFDLGHGETLPGKFGDIEAVISLGGPMNVYEEEEYPFLKEEDIFLKKALQEEIPVLGICLGAQLLAKACGAEVKRAPENEIGWKSVELTQAGRDDSLFQGLPARLDVFQWHQDSFGIPEGGLHLAESQVCPHQAFRCGKRAYGLQFHVEVTPEMLEVWIQAYTKKDAVGFGTEGMLVESYKREEALRRQADMIYLNFSRIIAESQKIRAG